MSDPDPDWLSRAQPRRLGVLGGTFDPVHVGHLVVAREMAEALDLDLVLFIPAYLPPHKEDREVSEVEHRLEMLRLALVDEDGFEVDAREIRRGGKSYTVHTLEALRTEMGSDTEIFFLIGADTLPEIKTWYEAPRLFEMARFATASRPGFPLSRIAELVPTFSDKIIRQIEHDLVETTPIGVSSTQIRHNVLNRKSIRHLVPPAVEEYIRTRNLYRDD